MKRHELWNDRAEKLMEKTFEKFGYGKKKEPVKEEKKEEIKENLQEARRYVESQVRETIDMNPEMAYQMVDDLRSYVEQVDMDKEAKEYILDELYAILMKMDADPDPGYELEENKNDNILDTMDANVDTMSETDVNDPTDTERLAMRIDILKKRIENKDGITGEDVVEELELISSMLQSSGEIKEEETENPEVERAEDAARKAKIKALQLQLKDLQSK